MFQTNNADFRGTDENLQQLAFARMRAIETGRSVVNLSTVGTSQVIAARRHRRSTGCPPTTAGPPARRTCRCAPGSPRRSSPAPAIQAFLALGEPRGARRARSVVRRPAACNAKTPAPEGTGVSEAAERQALILSSVGRPRRRHGGRGRRRGALRGAPRAREACDAPGACPSGCGRPCRRCGRRSRCPRRCEAGPRRRRCGTPTPRGSRRRPRKSLSCHVRTTCTCRCAVRAHGTRRPLRSVGSGRRVGCRADCGLPLCGPLVALRYNEADLGGYSERGALENAFTVDAQCETSPIAPRTGGVSASQRAERDVRAIGHDAVDAQRDETAHVRRDR